MYKPRIVRCWPVAYLRRRSPEFGGLRGYSTLEVVIAVLVGALLMTVGVTNVRKAMAREDIDGWVRAMTYDIAAGRQAALTRRTTVTVSVTTTTYTVGILGGGVLRHATVPSGASIVTTCLANACAFDRRGIPTASGTFSITSTSAGRSYTITIEPWTGRVSYREP